MKTLSKLVSTSSISLLVITSPVLISGSHKKIHELTSTSSAVSAVHYTATTNTTSTTNRKDNFNYRGVFNTESTNSANNAAILKAKKAFELKMIVKQANFIFDSMRLYRSGLNEKAFEYAWRGYQNLLKRGIISKSNVLSICDFTQSSRSKRLYVIDVLHHKLLYNTYVSHGMNSGVEYVTSFSNDPESFKTSLGFYLTKKSYLGRNGMSMKLIGLERGFNDKASKRNIVLHGADYMTNEYLQNNGEMGRSLGCAAIPTDVNPKVIKTIRNGSALFMYYPSKKYLNASSVING